MLRRSKIDAAQDKLHYKEIDLCILYIRKPQSLVAADTGSSILQLMSNCGMVPTCITWIPDASCFRKILLQAESIQYITVFTSVSEHTYLVETIHKSSFKQ